MISHHEGGVTAPDVGEGDGGSVRLHPLPFLRLLPLLFPLLRVPLQSLLVLPPLHTATHRLSRIRASIRMELQKGRIREWWALHSCLTLHTPQITAIIYTQRVPGPRLPTKVRPDHEERIHGRLLILHCSNSHTAQSSHAVLSV